MAAHACKSSTGAPMRGDPGNLPVSETTQISKLQAQGGTAETLRDPVSENKVNSDWKRRSSSRWITHTERDRETERKGSLVPHVQVNNSPFLFLSPFTLLFYALGPLFLLSLYPTEQLWLLLYHPSRLRSKVFFLLIVSFKSPRTGLFLALNKLYLFLKQSW